MAANKKKRLDVLVFDKGLASSRQRASALIMSGNILVNNQLVDKPGSMVLAGAEIVNKGPNLPFVSRGGFKIEKAIQSLDLDVSDMLCLDVGASTGGFTDCLLQHGASRVYAIDVGYGQLDWKLRQDPRVVVIERTNIRYATEEILPEPFDLISIDVSFISLKIVIPAIKKFLKKDGKILALIKPQFEVGKNQVGKGGVVKNQQLHQSVIKELSEFFSNTGFKIGPVITSPILGPKGNKEFIIYLTNQISLWG
ncbi:MAG: TlyA family RNA methyltransferase [Desulfobacteraceae bacterium]|jgi:23S rRNA (cytidine1920-2'-O)/16S rRNA (cytidine1409-2'-O)-methyltransferase|nr:TlyA family RNA methyltransferase [Desulfobacteraceae bacterium]